VEHLVAGAADDPSDGAPAVPGPANDLLEADALSGKLQNRGVLALSASGNPC
jgi:hypothetical protein